MKKEKLLELTDVSGAHWVLCGKDKIPHTKAWQETGATNSEVMRHTEGGGSSALCRPASAPLLLIST